MKIYTSIVVENWYTSVNRTIELSWFEYCGPVSEAKGASQQEKDLNKQQAEFYKTMTADYEAQFAKQSAVIDAINKVAQPILAAGPGQYGFAPAEDTAYRTQASEGTAANYQAAKKAVGEQLATAGGGNEFLPSGAADQINAQVDTAAAADESNKALQITEAGYAKGAQNYAEAANMESQAAGLINPLGYSGAATSAGSSAFQGADTIQQQDSAASPWGAIGGLLGGAASAFTGGFGTALGGKLGGKKP